MRYHPLAASSNLSPFVNAPSPNYPIPLNCPTFPLPVFHPHPLHPSQSHLRYGKNETTNILIIQCLKTKLFIACLIDRLPIIITFSQEMVQPKTYFATFNEIVPKLFIGNSDSAYDPKVLDLIGVSHILIMGSQLEIKYPDCYTYKKIPLEDSVKTNLLQYIDEGIAFIQSGIDSDGVLVHCRFGISRSSAMVIAYLMKTKKQNFWKSFNEVRHKRDYVKPNKGFVKQLMAYESTLNLNQ